MFQFRRFPTYAYFIQHTLVRYGLTGFPHSEICGSSRMCRFPQLIAACHVLRRLLMPRHSPCALSSLTCSFWFSFLRIMQALSSRVIFEIVFRYPLILLLIFHKMLLNSLTSVSSSLLPCFVTSSFIVQFSRCSPGLY